MAAIKDSAREHLFTRKKEMWQFSFGVLCDLAFCYISAIIGHLQQQHVRYLKIARATCLLDFTIVQLLVNRGS